MHFMWLWIIQIYSNYQEPFYPVTIHQRHTFWLLICIIQSLSSVTVCIIPGNICLIILYLYYQPSPSCYCCYLYLSGLLFNFQFQYSTATSTSSVQLSTQKQLTFVSLPVSMLQFSPNTQWPLLQFKFKILYYRIPSHITSASVDADKNVMYYTYPDIQHSLSTQLATPKQNTSIPLLQVNQFSVCSKKLL